MAGLFRRNSADTAHRADFISLIPHMWALKAFYLISQYHVLCNLSSLLHRLVCADVIISTDAKEACKGVDIAVMVGGFPRKGGMERKDVMAKNVAIYKSQAAALESGAKPDVKVMTPAPCFWCRSLSHNCDRIGGSIHHSYGTPTPSASCTSASRHHDGLATAKGLRCFTPS